MILNRKYGLIKKIRLSSNFNRTILILFVIYAPRLSAADIELEQIIDLNGRWKFEVGDNPRWINRTFDDSQWESIIVPSTWEEEGFPGYDGFACYRMHFTVDPIYKDKVLYLILGKIDDVDEVYINGQMVGYRGSLPPDFVTWAHSSRRYRINNSCINFGRDNVLVVRVFDFGGVGGIKTGKNGIYVADEIFIPDLDLSGIWKFTPGDDKKYSDPAYDDTGWQSVQVPALWAFYGLKDYDGFAWYRKEFFLNHQFEGEQLVLLMGKIDDIDEVYLNNQRIGKTGHMDDDTDDIIVGNMDWQQLRAYTIPKNLIRIGGNNSLSVRVYDLRIYGGIYEGPLGITTRTRFKEWQNKNKSFFDILFQMLQKKYESIE